MRSLWLLLVGSVAVAGCWVTRGEVLDKVAEIETGDTGDTGD